MTSPNSNPLAPTRKRPKNTAPKKGQRIPVVQGEKLRGEAKTSRIPVKIAPQETYLKKPPWIRVKVPTDNSVADMKALLRKQKLSSVCEEAACPNLSECFSSGTATFMIMGEICTRRCPFCDVAHGRPNPLDQDEPKHLAEAIHALKLKYVVITSVDRDDLIDGGAQHFADCISRVHSDCPDTKIEVLVPDFRGRMDIALDILVATPPDVFNHNIETVPRLYKAMRPGSDYQFSLTLLQKFKQRRPESDSKSGIMVGLGETKQEVIDVLHDLKAHDVDMVTIGQYLQPSKFHAPVERYVHPDEFAEYAAIGESLGFKNIASGPMVRSSYHADLQHQQEKIGRK